VLLSAAWTFPSSTALAENAPQVGREPPPKDAALVAEIGKRLADCRSRATQQKISSRARRAFIQQCLRK
jgi:hypothetical protein